MIKILNLFFIWEKVFVHFHKIWSDWVLRNSVQVLFSIDFEFKQPWNISRALAIVQTSTQRNTFHTTLPTIISHISSSLLLIILTGDEPNIYAATIKWKQKKASTSKMSISRMHFGFCKYFSICKKTVKQWK